MSLGARVFRGIINGTVNTGINVRSSNFGKTLIIIGSLNGGDGDQTASYVKMVRCPYNGNTINVTTIHEDYKDSYAKGLMLRDITVNEEGYLILTDTSNANYVTIISNR